MQWPTFTHIQGIFLGYLIPPTLNSAWIGPNDTPGSTNGGADAPMRPEHVSFVVDHISIYWAYWTYECRNDGSVVRGRVCVRETPRKIGKSKEDSE